jgi:hypothetical protein
MTLISLQSLALFLNKFKPKGRIGDFGGTDKIGSAIVKQMMALDHLTVRKDDPGPDLTVILNGVPKKNIPEYVVLDYDNGIDLMKPVKGPKFDSGICMDLLEHTENPFIIAKNISDAIKPGGMLFVTVPWVWELHYYPKDYWRFCPQGLEALFPDMKARTIEIIRDPVPEEDLPRHRLVAVFKKK